MQLVIAEKPSVVYDRRAGKNSRMPFLYSSVVAGVFAAGTIM